MQRTALAASGREVARLELDFDHTKKPRDPGARIDRRAHQDPPRPWEQLELLEALASDDAMDALEDPEDD